jgi:hypothetical protein
VTGGILHQFINGKHKGKSTKVKQSEAGGSGGRKRRGASVHVSSSSKRAKGKRSEGRKLNSYKGV